MDTGNPHTTSAKIDRKRLLPPHVVAKFRTVATDWLCFDQRKQLLVVAIENGLSPTEAGYTIAKAVAEIEKTLAMPEPDRDATLAAICADADKRLQPFALILSQLSPARHGIFSQCADGHAKFAPAAAATARSTMCQRDVWSYYAREKVKPKQRNDETTTHRARKFFGKVSRKVCACHVCERGPGEVCWRCRRISQDDIRIERTPKNERPDLTIERAAPADAGRDPAQATTLPPTVEDTLRRLLATVASLPEMGILHLVHVARRSPEPFAVFLANFAAEMLTYAKGQDGAKYARSMLKAAWDSIITQNATFAVLRAWPTGHGGRKANDDDADGTRRERKRKRKRGAEIDNQQVEDEMVEEDRTRDRAETFAADRSESTTRYFFDDGSGTDW